MGNIISLLVFLCVLFLALALRILREAQLRKVYGLLGLSNDDEKTSVEKIVSKAASKVDTSERIGYWLLKAGIIMPAYRFLGYVVIAMGGFFVVGLLLTYKFASALLFSFIGAGVAWFLVRRQSGKRQQEFELQMESVVAVMSSSLRAGASLAQTIENASKELDEPAASEFAMAGREIGMGLTAADALVRLSERVLSEDMQILSTAAKIQAHSGGNLARIIDNLGGTVRDRKTLRSALKAYTAEGKLSGIVIGLIPIGVVGILSIMNPGYFSPMLANPVGRIAMVLSFIMIFVGWFVINRITQNLDF